MRRKPCAASSSRWRSAAAEGVEPELGAGGAGRVGVAEQAGGLLPRPGPVGGCGGSLALLPAVAGRFAQQLQESNPNSAQAARDVSVSLNKLGDFYLARGQSGDAEEALRCFQQSLAIASSCGSRTRTRRRRRGTCRCRSRSWGTFYLSRGQAGDAEEALRCFQRVAGRSAQQLRESNPNSAQAARDVSVSLERAGRLLPRPGPVRGCGGSLALLPAVAGDPAAAGESNPNSARRRGTCRCR